MEKVPGTLASFNQIWIFSTGLNSSLHYQISRKFVQLEASLNIRTDVRRDSFDDYKRRFCVYVNVPEN